MAKAIYIFSDLAALINVTPLQEILWQDVWSVRGMWPDQGPGSRHLRPQELRRGREGVRDILPAGDRWMHQEM